MGNMSERPANSDGARQNGAEPPARHPFFSRLRARLLAEPEPRRVAVLLEMIARTSDNDELLRGLVE